MYLYVVDTSSLIHLNRINPMDVYPSVWRRIEGLIKAGRFIAPKEVLFEIQEGDDDLLDWAENQELLFKDPTLRQIEIVQQILQKYPSIIKIGKKYDADPWVVALAYDHATSPQKTLIELEPIVVTEEKLRGNKIKIPFICKQYGLDFINIITMFRTEGWKF